MVSNLVMEITIYNFDLFHSALIDTSLPVYSVLPRSVSELKEA